MQRDQNLPGAVVRTNVFPLLTPTPPEPATVNMNHASMSTCQHANMSTCRLVLSLFCAVCLLSRLRGSQDAVSFSGRCCMLWCHHTAHHLNFFSCPSIAMLLLRCCLTLMYCQVYYTWHTCAYVSAPLFIVTVWSRAGGDRTGREGGFCWRAPGIALAGVAVRPSVRWGRRGWGWQGLPRLGGRSRVYLLELKRGK